MVLLAVMITTAAHAAGSKTTHDQSPATNEAKRAERTDRNRLWRGDPTLLGKHVTAIRYDGLNKTVKKVVVRELLFAVGKPLKKWQLIETVQRLRNLGVFRVVTALLIADGPGVKLRLQFDEKWTLMPVLSWGRGGGRLYLAAGGQDIHLAGRLFRLQGLYTFFAGTHSFSLRFDDPRVLDTRLHFSGYGELANRNRYLYDNLGELQGMYSRHRNRLMATVWDRRDPQSVWSINAQLVDDNYDESLLNDDELKHNEQANFTAPPAQRLVLLKASYSAGRLDLDDYIVSGRYVGGSIGVGISASQHSSSFVSGDLSTKWAWALPYRQNIVVRAQVGATTSDAAEFQHYVGGLWYVRGFFEGRFRGPMMWVGNIEYRVPSLHRRDAVLQHVFFTDVGDAGDTISHFARRPAIAVGTGGRLILPLIANFVARLDIAWFIEPVRDFDPSRDWRISFGSQQHF